MKKAVRMMSLALLFVLSATSQSTQAQDTGEAEAKEPTPQETRAAMVKKAWDYLQTMYNKPSPKDDRAGILSGWGPKSMNIPYTALVLSGLVGSEVWDAKDDKIRDSVNFIIDNQEPEGGFSYMPVSIMPKMKGIRAVYITSIVAELLSELNTLDGPWKGKLSDAIAKARDYLKTAQVGNPDGPAPDYEKDKAGFGGWAYSKQEIKSSVEKKGKPAANMSTSTFALDALKACGVDKDDKLWERAVTFLKRNQNAGEIQDEGFEAIDAKTGKRIKYADKESPDYGGAIYSEETTKAGHTENEDGSITLFSYGSMTYNLLRSYLHAGLTKDDVPVQLAWNWIRKNFTVKKVPGFRAEDKFEMGLYYYYRSMSRTMNVLGEDEVKEIPEDRGLSHDWRKELIEELQNRQKDDGHWVNENHTRWQENSPVLCTAYVLDTLKHAKK